jgi:hypothetical protein
MAKKNFKTGIDNLINDSRESIVFSRIKVEKPVLPEFQKATYYYNSKTLLEIKSIAYFDRKYIGEVIEEALSEYIAKHPNIDKAIIAYSKKN